MRYTLFLSKACGHGGKPSASRYSSGIQGARGSIEAERIFAKKRCQEIPDGANCAKKNKVRGQGGNIPFAYHLPVTTLPTHVLPCS